MGSLPADDFDAWNEASPKGEHGAYHPNPPKTGSVFLFINVTDPLPWPATKAAWSWFGDTRELLGYLINVALPDLAGVLFLGSHETTHVIRTRLEDLFSVEESPYPGDAEFFTAMSDELRVLTLEADNPPVQKLSDILERFTHRYGRGPGYDLEATIYPNLEEAYAHWLERAQNRYSPDELAPIKVAVREAISDVDSNPESADLLGHMFCIDVD